MTKSKNKNKVSATPHQATSSSHGNKIASDSHPTVIVEESSDAAIATLKQAILEAIDQHGEGWQQLPAGKALRLEHEGVDVAVVMAYQDFEALLSRLDDLEDALDARIVLDAIARGDETPIPLEQLKAELRAEGLLGE